MGFSITAMNRTEQQSNARQRKAKHRGQPFTEGCPRFFESQGNAPHCNAAQCKATQGKAPLGIETKRGQPIDHSGLSESR